MINYVMHRVYENDVDAEAADVMTEDVIADVSRWTDVGSQDEVRKILLACSTPDTELFPDIDPDDVMRRVFIVAGDLLGWVHARGHALV